MYDQSPNKYVVICFHFSIFEPLETAKYGLTQAVLKL